MNAPSAQPITEAREDPAASITAMMSSMCCSTAGTPGTRSDIPVPRLSKVITRQNLPSRSRKAANSGSSHITSRWEVKPWIPTMSSPEPYTW